MGNAGPTHEKMTKGFNNYTRTYSIGEKKQENSVHCENDTTKNGPLTSYVIYFNLLSIMSCTALEENTSGISDFPIILSSMPIYGHPSRFEAGQRPMPVAAAPGRCGVS